MTVEELRAKGSPDFREFLKSNINQWTRIGSSCFTDKFEDIDLIVNESKIPFQFIDEFNELYELTISFHHKDEDRNYVDPAVIIDQYFRYIEYSSLNGSIEFDSGREIKVQFVILSPKTFEVYKDAALASLNFYDNACKEHREKMRSSKDFRVGFFSAYKYMNLDK